MKIFLNFLLSAVMFSVFGQAISGWENFNEKYQLTGKEKILWQEKFDGKLEDFDISFRDGAEGKVEIKNSALKIIKSNYSGYIVVKSKKPLKSEIGAALQTSIICSSRNADPEYAIGYLRLFGEKEDLSYFSKLDGRGPGGPRMSKLINSPENSWIRKLAHLQLSEKSGDLITPAIVVAGSPSESLWDNWYIEDFNTAKEVFRQNVGENFNFPAGEECDGKFFAEMLRNEIDHQAKIEVQDGLSKLVVDGKTVPPYFFIPFAGHPGKESVNSKNMADAGVDLQFIIIHFGNDSKKQHFWTKDGFDVQGAVNKIRSAMRCAPDAKFLLTLTINPYREFADEFPEEVWSLYDGTPVYGSFIHSPQAIEAKKPERLFYWISMYSTVWRDAVKKNISLLIKELKASNLSKKIVGVHFTGFHDNQFSTRHVDFSKPAKVAFRKYLKEKYKNIKSLQSAWKNSSITSFDDIEPENFGKKLFFDPDKEQSKIDYLHFLKNGAMDLQEDLGGFIKKEFGKNIVVVRYCMGTFGGTLNSAFDIWSFLNSKNVDILIAQPAYARRIPGMSIGFRLPLASFHHHGKIFVNDFDIRTYAAIHGKETELRMLGLSCVINDRMWNSVHRKMSGQMIASGMGYRYLDMGNGWFSPPEIMSDIADSSKKHRDLVSGQQKKRFWHPDAAFVIDEKGMLLRNFPGNYYNFEEYYTVGYQLNYLASSGVPFDIWMLEDLLASPEIARKYKMLVFGGMNNVDNARRKLLDSLKNNHRTLVFLSGSGRLGKGESATGFAAKYERRPESHETVPEKNEKNNMLSPLFSDTVLLQNIGKNAPKNMRPGRFMVLPGPGLTVHARYRDNGNIAIASRNFRDFRSVYVGNSGGLTPEFFNHLARTGGVYSVADSGIQVNMNGNFMAVHGIIPGKYRIKLPFSCDVINLKDGSVTGKNIKFFDLNVSSGTSWWFLLK